MGLPPPLPHRSASRGHLREKNNLWQREGTGRAGLTGLKQFLWAMFPGLQPGL